MTATKNVTTQRKVVRETESTLWNWGSFAESLGMTVEEIVMVALFGVSMLVSIKHAAAMATKRSNVRILFACFMLACGLFCRY